MVEVAVDYENNADAWWDAARLAVRAGNRPPQWHIFKPLFEYDDSVSCLSEEANDFVEWARQFPGYDDGPEYAKHPFVMREG